MTLKLCIPNNVTYITYQVELYDTGAEKWIDVATRYSEAEAMEVFEDYIKHGFPTQLWISEGKKLQVSKLLELRVSKVERTTVAHKMLDCPSSD